MLANSEFFCFESITSRTKRAFPTFYYASIRVSRQLFSCELSPVDVGNVLLYFAACLLRAALKLQTVSFNLAVPVIFQRHRLLADKKPGRIITNYCMNNLYQSYYSKFYIPYSYGLKRHALDTTNQRESRYGSCLAFRGEPARKPGYIGA